MANSRDSKTPETHILSFSYGDDQCCTLTARINGARFHVVVDAASLENASAKNDNICAEYRELLKAVQQKDNQEEQEDEEGDNGGDSQDSAIDLSSDRGQKYPRDAEGGNPKDEVTATGDAELNLQNWMLCCLGDQVEQLTADTKEDSDKQTLHDWYHNPAYFFELTVQDKSLTATELKETPELRKCLDDLLPKLPMPKYIRDLSIPRVPASDIQVFATSTDPSPIHPTTVRVKLNGKEEEQFFKPVDPTQPQPTKRELKILTQIEKLKLHKEFRVPRVLGLVSDDKDDKINIMGFLLTPITDPVPLTTLLETESNNPRSTESNRDKWSKECSRIVETLHKHDIVWGDAKADNFMVDENDELWIIDFGGSFTEGWIDEELMETREGDEMGLGKIVGALEDPDGATFDPDEGSKDRDADGGGHEEHDKKHQKSRDVQDVDEHETKPAKKQELQQEDQREAKRDSKQEGQNRSKSHKKKVPKDEDNTVNDKDKREVDEDAESEQSFEHDEDYDETEDDEYIEDQNETESEHEAEDASQGEEQEYEMSGALRSSQPKTTSKKRGYDADLAANEDEPLFIPQDGNEDDARRSKKARRT